MIDFNKIDYMEYDGVDHSDYPDYCDTFAVYAEIGGVELTDGELDTLNDHHKSIVSEMFFESL